jgi:methylglutaconyl-CoA hydratase
MEIVKELKNDTLFLGLNRPEKGNSFNLELIRSLRHSLNEAELMNGLRFIVISGQGKHFCLGADLNWMIQSTQLTESENEAESTELAALYKELANASKITIALVNGSSFGGGIGLLAACDFVFAANKALFSFSEVKLGMVPATIAPYVLRRSGELRSLQLMLSGERFDSEKAKEIGLVDTVVNDDMLDQTLEAKLKELRQGGPLAQQHIKKLIAKLSPGFISEEVQNDTARILAIIRRSEEAQEGMHSFIEKRDPQWRK